MKIEPVIPAESAFISSYARASAIVGLAANEVLCRTQLGGTPCEWIGDLGDLLMHKPGTFQSPSLNLLSELVHDHDKSGFAARWSAFLAGDDEDSEMEIRLRRACGAPGWFRVSRAADLRHPGGLVYRFQPADKSILLREARNERFRMDAIQSLAGGIAHEFNNHLTPVTGFIELALESIGREHPAAADLEVALKQVNACTDLISHMQSYSGSGVLSPRPTDVAQSTSSFIRHSMNLEPNSDGISLEESYESDIPAVHIDHGHYRKILSQIVRNSLAAMAPDGTIRVRAEIVPDAPVEEPNPLGYVRISIRDNGCGMEPQVLRQIRDPFFTTKGRATAKGLGIPMVHGMMRQHKGAVAVDSNPGCGTTVSLYFPIPEPMAPKVEAPAASPSAVGVGRVLLADDEDVIRRLMVRVFQGKGWLVQEAHDFREMLGIVEKDPGWFDLILMDFTMPGPTPEEAVERLKACQCSAKIMVVTGMAQDERLDGLVEACDGAYMPKPFSPKTLLTAVDEFLGGQPGPDSPAPE